jgi:hypothetical protein
MLLGWTATVLLHEAPCSVLVARQPASLNGFPSSITVGVDGSTPSGTHSPSHASSGTVSKCPFACSWPRAASPDFDGLRSIEDPNWDEEGPSTRS